jgi:uncharacterized membrane protein
MVVMPAVYLDAVLHPPRSLSDRGFSRLMALLAGIGAAAGLGFWLQGAWPVIGFFGLELLALWIVFQMTFRAQTARTYLRVTADAVDLRKVDARGRERRARLPAGFARVELDPDARGARALRLAAAGRAYAIGEHLTATERESLAEALRAALARARQERHRDEPA